ncbi:hypothetical protein FI667_g17657, partial [Globisporangium splendens]
MLPSATTTVDQDTRTSVRRKPAYDVEIGVPEIEIREIEAMTDRAVDIDGVLKHCVKWVLHEGDPEDSQCTWEPVENLQGVEVWLVVLDNFLQLKEAGSMVSLWVYLSFSLAMVLTMSPIARRMSDSKDTGSLLSSDIKLELILIFVFLSLDLMERIEPVGATGYFSSRDAHDLDESSIEYSEFGFGVPTLTRRLFALELQKT